jgi:hypothetical protein
MTDEPLPELDQETIDALSDVFRSGPTEQNISDWIADDVGRRRATAGLILGTIRWKKSLGKPTAPAMASGFEIKHYFWYEQWLVEEGGFRKKAFWMGPFNEVSAWDLSDEGDEHRVGFAGAGMSSSPIPANKIAVALSPDHHWYLPPAHAAGPVSLSPPERVFNYEDKLILLEDFQVVWHGLYHP